MNAKIIAIIAVVVIVVAGGAAAVVLLNNHGNTDEDEFAYFDGVGLKVLGNVNKDNYIDNKDYEALQKLIEDGASASDNPLADANNDKVLDDKDLAIVKGVIDKTKTKIWHISYHDTDGNGTMDRELVETTIPVTSTIMTGSANNYIMFTMLGITSEVKGSCYSTGSNDSYLYGDTFLASGKQIGTSSTTIDLENGKIGSSNKIDVEEVTCLVTDWNRTYITNEAAFETAGVDVVRIAAASFVPDVYTHTIKLLGLIFDKGENSDKLLKLYNDTYDEVTNAVKTIPADKVKKAVASSMDGNLSSDGSDYTAFCTAAGAEYGLKGFDFGGSTSVTVSDNLGVFDTRNYQYDYIVHIRTALKYDCTEENVAKQWSTYANAMNKWEKAYDGQILVSGAIPIPCRIAFIAYAMYGDTVDAFSKEWADGVNAEFEKLYGKADIATDTTINHKLLLTGYEYTVSIGSEEVKLTKVSDGTEVTDGTKLPYGTKVHIECRAGQEKAGYVLKAEGSTVDSDSNFLVIDNVNARYVDPVVLANLTALANKMVETYGGEYYMKTCVANDGNEGNLSITNTNYKGTDSTVSYSTKFEYVAGGALTKYNEYCTALSDSSKNGYTKYNSDIITKNIMNGSEKVGEVTVGYSGTPHTPTTTAPYTASSGVWITAYVGDYVLHYEKGMYNYNYTAGLNSKTNEEELEYFQPEAEALANALVTTMSILIA